jgi:hypothetical protein
MESAYRLSLIIQTLHTDAKKGDKAAILKDIDTLITKLPFTLDLCNRSEWADFIRKRLPLDCVHAVENLVSLVPMFIQNYDHFEWLVKNFQIFLNAGAMVAMHCPVF